MKDEQIIEAIKYIKNHPVGLLTAIKILQLDVTKEDVEEYFDRVMDEINKT